MRSLPLALLLVALLPQAAAAATVSLATYRESGTPHNPDHLAAMVTVIAAPGEANRVSAGPLPGGAEVVDENATLEAGHGCAAVDEHRVSCQDPAVARVTVRVEAGDGDDLVRVS